MIPFPYRRLYRRQARMGLVLERLSFFLLLALLAWVPLPFGSNRPWAEWLFCCAVFGLLALWFVAYGQTALRLRHLSWGCFWMALLWIAWLGWIYLQTLPLPQRELAELAPHRWIQVQEAARFLMQPMPDSVAMSVDPEQTRSKLLLSAGYAALFLLLVLSLRRRRRLRSLLWLLLACGLGQALYGSLMTVSGLEYGAWGLKEHYRGVATGTFVNRNHFAGYLELCLAAVVGLIIATPAPRWAQMDWRRRLRRWLALIQDGPLFARVVMVALFIGLLLSQSRMGNAAAVAGLGIGLLLFALFSRRKKLGRWIILLGSVVLVDVLVVGQWFRLDQLAARYEQAESDFAARGQVLVDIRSSMLPAYWPQGSGLGTFGLAYPEFRAPEVFLTYDHAHNDYAQFAVEVGLPGLVLLALMVGSTVLRALLIARWRSDPLARGVAGAGLVAMSAFAVHSYADFNLQIPANAATLVALMAAVWAVPLRSSRLNRRKVGKKCRCRPDGQGV